jgi:hypothetical protein
MNSFFLHMWYIHKRRWNPGVVEHPAPSYGFCLHFPRFINNLAKEDVHQYCFVYRAYKRSPNWAVGVSLTSRASCGVKSFFPPYFCLKMVQSSFDPSWLMSKNLFRCVILVILNSYRVCWLFRKWTLITATDCFSANTTMAAPSIIMFHLWQLAFSLIPKWQDYE